MPQGLHDVRQQSLSLCPVFQNVLPGKIRGLWHAARERLINLWRGHVDAASVPCLHTGSMSHTRSAREDEIFCPTLLSLYTFTLGACECGTPHH